MRQQCQRVARHALTTTGQSVPLQYDGDAVQASVRVPFDKSELPLVQGAPGLVTSHGRRLTVERMGAGQLAGHYTTTAADRVAQANRRAHPGEP